jgi:hypothetical protein
VAVEARCYLIRTAAEAESYLALTPDDVIGAFRVVTGHRHPGRFVEDGVLFDLDWGSCTVTGTPFELRLRYEGASTGRIADGLTARLVEAIEDITGEPHAWERRVSAGA